MEPTIFELNRPGRVGCSLPSDDVPDGDYGLPQEYRRENPPALPEMDELSVVRHFTRLSRLNFSIDSHFYPLGSCTMKYNPKINDRVASFPGFTHLHPYQPQSHVQGVLEILYNLEKFLNEICAMDRFSLQPAAGAHGELLGLLIVRAYFDRKGEQRRKILIPDAAHGTNPSSAHLAGFEVVSIPTTLSGELDIEVLQKYLNQDLACLMLTNPTTLGLFEPRIVEIAEKVHEVGGLLYYDGANLNPLLGIARPGDMGFDIVHINLHKTFSTPHGGGGPGAGPLGVKKHLVQFLPKPLLEKSSDGKYFWNHDLPDSVGRMRAFHGNVGILIRAFCYMVSLGCEGLERVGKNAILNANYLLFRIKDVFTVPYNRKCMHEFVVSGSNLKPYGVKTLDLAKRLLDYGVHPPTIYFPLIVEEALMIEPTETETRETLDQFVEILISIVEEAKTQPELLHQAPQRMPVKRLDEVKAVKDLRLVW